MIKPTRWPLFKFSITLWKLHIFTELMTADYMRREYSYTAFFVWWGNTMVYEFKLYDTDERIEARK